MTVKCSKNNYLYLALTTVCCVLAGILAWFRFRSTSAVILVTIPAFLIILRFFITTSRTIIMEQEGCTIKFLWAKKTYRWDQLQTKKVINLTDYHGTYVHHARCAVLSPLYVKNPFKLMPLEYNTFYLPPNLSIWGYFFVYLDSKPKELKVSDNTYVVNETEFVRLMKEWNVDVENLVDTPL